MKRLPVSLLILGTTLGCLETPAPLPSAVFDGAFADMQSETRDAQSDRGGPPVEDSGYPDLEPNDVLPSDDASLDVGPSDMRIADSGVAVCGDGVISSTEECDDGNSVLEECATYGELCMVCGPDCTLQQVPGPTCGDGLHHPREECDRSAPNIHAAACTGCRFDFQGEGGGSLGTRTSRVSFRAHIHPIDAEGAPDVNAPPVDIDMWVFHPNALYEEPLSSLDFAFSQASAERPPWLPESTNLDESDPAQLIVSIDGPTTDVPCAERTAGNRLLLAVAARELRLDGLGAPRSARAELSFTLGRLSGPVATIEFTDNRDFFVVGAFQICIAPDGVSHGVFRYLNQPYRVAYDPEP